MSIFNKKRVLLVTLIVLGLWPMMHMAAARALELNVWKLGSWGMYAAPPPKVAVKVMARKGTRWMQVKPSAVQPHYSRFLDCRRALGRLCSAKELGDATLAMLPVTYREVAVVVQTRRLTNDGTVDGKTRRFAYKRATQ